MHYLLLILVAASTTEAFAPTQALTVGFESKSACEFAAAWAQNEQVRTTCIPAHEAMWNQAPLGPPIALKSDR